MPTTTGPRARTTRVTAGTRTRRRQSLLVAAAAALVVSAGCGDVDDQAQAPPGGDTDQAEQAPTATQTSTPTATAAPGPTDGDGEPTPTPAGEETGAAAETVTFVAVDIDYSQAPDQVPAGPLVVRLVNDGALPHNVTIEELDDRTVVHTGGDESGEGEVELAPGTYTYYCDVPGHRLAGMEGTLEVTEDAPG